MVGYSGKWHQHSVGKFTVVYKVHIYNAMATILVACVLLSLLCAFAACLVILGNDYHYHQNHYSVENSLWCIKCTFTMQWQQYLVPVSYNVFKTLNKQLYQLHQSWFTITATCVWVKLSIVHFGINAPSLWCVYGVH